MRMKLFSMFLAFVACALGAAVGGEPGPGIESLIGKWQVINERLNNTGVVIEWEFTPNEVIVRNPKSGLEYKRVRYAIDTTKSPHWITSEIDDSATGDKGDRRLGIFRIQAGELHVKQEISDGGKRPDRFEGQFSRFKRPSQEKKAAQAGTGQPATRSESKSKGGDKPQPESEGRSR
jgi:uncharacterized protein (TIGR03067 family)